MISLKQLTYALAVEKTLHFKKCRRAEQLKKSPAWLATVVQ